MAVIETDQHDDVYSELDAAMMILEGEQWLEGKHVDCLLLCNDARMLRTGDLVLSSGRSSENIRKIYKYCSGYFKEVQVPAR